MDINTFIDLVERSENIGDERKQMIIENAQWMTDEEHEFIISEIRKADMAIDENNRDLSEKLDHISETLKAFEQEELPKLRQEEEASEHTEELSEAERLLQNM